MKLLEVFSPSELALHFFSSNLCGEAQLDAAYAALECCHSPSPLAQWDAILGAMNLLPWIVFPKDVEITDVETHGIIGLVGHLWNSNLDSILAENILNEAYEVVEKNGETWPAWLMVREMAETYYEGWANERMRRYAV